MNFVFFATRWGRAFGGLNAFNQQFMEGLVQVLGGDDQLFCATLDPGEGEIAAAAAFGIRLIPIMGKGDVATFDVSWRVHVTEWLEDNAPGVTIDYWVGHDVISGQIAVDTAKKAGATAALIHHMSYHSYQGLKGDPKDAQAKINRQKALFSQDAVLFGVGPKLVASCKNLSLRGDVHLLTPGFTEEARTLPVEQDTLRGIMFGRLDAESDIIKQGRLAVAAFGVATKRGREQGLAAFSRPMLHLYGVDDHDVMALQALVKARAGTPINILPLPFAEQPREMFETLGRANLALMVSLHDGFGLSGWEAIGAEAPLVVGEDTGLYRLVESLDGAGEGCLHKVSIQGGVDEENFCEADVEAGAQAVLAIGRNLDRAKTRAATLRKLLVEKFGCTWADTARTFLVALGAQGAGGAPASERAPPVAPAPRPISARSMRRDNRVPRCADISVAATQGSTNQDIGLLAEVRFGQEILEIEGLQVAYGVAQAALTLHPSDCGIKAGRRLGDSKADSPDVAAHPPNRWVITGPKDGEILSRKALGDEVLCTLEASGETCGVDLVLSCEKRDIRYDFLDPEGAAMDLTQKRIIEVFLGKCLAGDSAVDGGVHLSLVSLQVGGDDDAA